MDWFETAAAAPLLNREQMLLSLHLPTLFGYHMLQVGDLFADEAFHASPIKHCMTMALDTGHVSADLAGKAEALPFERESLDLIVLPHVLEFNQTPHALLREVDRCLIPEGHVLIFGFNPWSHWQLLRGLLRWHQPVPWRGQYISLRRLGDWLKLLGFEVVASRTFLYRPPFSNETLMQRLQFLEAVGERLLPWMGGAYGLLARKRVESLTPLRPRLKSSRSVIGVGLSGP